MTRTRLHDCKRDDDSDITVAYEQETYHPEVGPSLSDPGCPAEGGNVTIIRAFDANGKVILTEKEEARITAWLEQNIEIEDDYDDYDDSDNYGDYLGYAKSLP